MANAVLLIECEDQQGIVSSITEFIYSNQGNIIDLDQYTDHDNSHFLMRLEWSMDSFTIQREKISEYFETLLGNRFSIRFDLYFTDERPRMGLFVTKLSHCLFDILGRWQSGELEVEIPVVISNHENLRSTVERFDIPFEYIPISNENKAEQEQKQLEVLSNYDIDFVVLARYMQIISPNFIKRYSNKIINIHHSFLPAFVGAKPYHAAFERGVKIIGATAHYVTDSLDAGPIIDQNIAHVSHRNSVKDLVKIGQDIEKLVLAKAINLHVKRKMLVVGNKTIVFH
ncbi:MAG: formyltetrahydrofolate deformylase [Flavobacteriales bacterium]|nr:formyltetrahydrofolate deformylase [Flavobacteriales bacterium]|tara:strand:- start:1218 stop:2072 length:855 start_codon:yes stop_codon:yes gene_type:complete